MYGDPVIIYIPVHKKPSAQTPKVFCYYLLSILQVVIDWGRITCAMPDV